MARGIKIPIGTDLTGLDRGLAQVQSRFRGLGANLATSLASTMAGVFSVRMFDSLLREFDQVAKQAARLGVGVEQFQRLRMAARLAGSEGETLARALISMNQRLQDSGGAGDRASEALRRLGIHGERFRQLGPERQIVELANAFHRAGGDGEAVASILDVMGMRAQTLLPLFRQTGEQLEDAFENTRVVSAEAMAQIEEARDEWERFKNSLKVGAAEASPPVLGFLSDMFARLGTERDAFRNLFNRTGELAFPEIPRIEPPAATIDDVPIDSPFVIEDRDESSVADAADTARLRAREQAIERVLSLEERLFEMRKRVAEQNMGDDELLRRREQEAKFLREVIDGQKQRIAVEAARGAVTGGLDQEDLMRRRQTMLEDELKLQETLLDVERLRARLANEKDDDGGAEAARLGMLTGAVSSLGRVGGDVGAGMVGRADPQLNLSRDRNRKLDVIADTLRTMAQGPGLTLS